MYNRGNNIYKLLYMHIWTEEPGGLQFVGSQESDMTECLSIYIHTCVCVCVCVCVCASVLLQLVAHTSLLHSFLRHSSMGRRRKAVKRSEGQSIRIVGAHYLTSGIQNTFLSVHQKSSWMPAFVKKNTFFSELCRAYQKADFKRRNWRFSH